METMVPDTFTAIKEKFNQIYRSQEVIYKYYHNNHPYNLGGDFVLEGVGTYTTEEYVHFVTYGLSDLYEKERDIYEGYSGFGTEFTL